MCCPGGISSLFLLSSFCLSTYQWSADVLLARVVHDKDVVRLHQLFLHARGREEDVVFMLDRNAAAGARHPAESVELAAERADQVGWVFRVLGFDERVGVVVLSGGSHFALVLLVCHRLCKVWWG
jgi:hypothetical protein